MTSILNRFDELLDRYFVYVVGLIAFLIYKKIQAKREAEAEETFTNNLFGLDTPEVEAAKETTKVVTGSGSLSDFLNPTASMTPEQLKAWNLLKKSDAEKLAARLASNIHGAFNPSGYGWMSGADGTDTAAIEQAFTTIKYQVKNNGAFFSLALVTKAYKDAYKSNLREDLESELSSVEVNKLYQL